IIIYELGGRLGGGDPSYRAEIVAFRLLQDFFNLFSATGRSLPALAVVGILLSWHIARNDTWRIRPGTLLGMGMECTLLGIPLILLSVAVVRMAAIPLSTATSPDFLTLIALSLGAGIYEELVFRLAAMTLLSLLFVDLLKFRKGTSLVLMVVVPALLFSLSHYLGNESFSWPSFTFRTAAGIYFGILFLCRGFGITAGTHAAYDAWIVCLATWAVR